MTHAQAHSYNAISPQRNAIFNDAAAAYEAARADVDTAIENGAGGDMTMVFDYRVMFDHGTRIDDAVLTYLGTGINDSAMHHDGTCANARVTRDMGGRRDDVWQGKAELDGLLVQTDARVR